MRKEQERSCSWLWWINMISMSWKVITTEPTLSPITPGGRKLSDSITRGKQRGRKIWRKKPSENTSNTQIIEKIILFNNDYKWLKYFIKEKKSQVVLLQIMWHNHTYQTHTCALIKKVIPERLQGRYEERKPSSRPEYSVKWTPSFAHMTAMSVKTGYITFIPCQWIVIPL